VTPPAGAKIFGLGIDIVEIARIETLLARHGERFLARVFTEDERRYCGGLRNAAACYAARFAAKEAISKAFGTGIGARLAWLDLSIQRSAEGKPSALLQNTAAEFARELGVTDVLVSLSHSEHYAVAQALALCA
jgi:holo-[acyl-carrier protein] synthase